ncbi:hypothetical protein BV25DRAFT_1818553 [Artomyces pyxidatus]|uniref:Uncharacterized protein n=1 Tax=Artomyces pyxidatus TaxID=48021 RepID=A0ACB8TID1_9AGAM|nr:hypothetical protein BV25DRAFT_1818553 [Artomyces pyxidatus]
MRNDTSHDQPPPHTACAPAMSPALLQNATLDTMSPIAEESPPGSSSTSTTGRRGSHAKNDALSDGGVPRTVRRRPSRLELWIDEQHGKDEQPPSMPPAAPGTAAHPYLAYPGLNTPRSPSADSDRASTAESFVLVDDDEAGSSSRTHDVFQARLVGITSPTQSSVATDITSSSSRPYSALFHSPPSLRNFHIALSPRRTSASTTHNSPSPTTPRHSIFHRQSTSMGHSRGLSLGSLTDQQSITHSPATPRSSRSFGTWKFRRPSVLGTFTPSEITEDDHSTYHLAPPRPSFSSTATFSSGTTDLSTPPKGPPSSIQTSPSLRPHTPSPSLWSLPRDASHLQDPPHSETSISVKPGSTRFPFSLKAHSNSVFPLRHVPAILPVPRDKRKKKLIISGIAVGDERRYQGVKQWCESFGEVNQITRMQNGDLHVDFRKSEVADTVCRINARVFIAKVGTVSLSWYTGKRPF